MEKARVAVVIACAALASCADASIRTAVYASVAEARAAGAVEQGWMPALPDGAFELRVAYDSAGDGRWGLFNFRQDTEAALRAQLGSDAVPLGNVEIDIPRRIEWWPVQLRGRLDEERVRATGLRAHGSSDGRYTFLVNWSQGRGYYWAR